MIYLGIGLLLAALALLAVLRPNADGDSHPVVSGVTISALFPTAVLGLITFGAAILLSALFS
ncbi:MAG TPA: hypothetical protein VGN82_24920 [Bosea sp. (in: a-proteobacteria)]|jgi:hypothetical protein|uniref:hypothetical protein n=1 Tax=Bosea sp. (in: a-proteobacteria) TaxID=1871050 RepID=UPI002E146182|nr:hypothetical protein [Bosea sp. (in: a-proteobacteria)]